MRISDWSSDVCSSDLDQLVAALDGAPDVPALGRDRLVTPVVAAAALDIEIAHHLIVASRIAFGHPDIGDEAAAARGRVLRPGALAPAPGAHPDRGVIVVEMTTRAQHGPDRKSVVRGKGVSVRVKLGG